MKIFDEIMDFATRQHFLLMCPMVMCIVFAGMAMFMFANLLVVVSIEFILNMIGVDSSMAGMFSIGIWSIAGVGLLCKYLCYGPTVTYD